MAENIFEELMTETEMIIGGHLKIRVEAKGLDICFEKTKKEKIRKALQETVSFVMRTTDLKKFSFEEQEMNNVHSLASVFMRLTGAGLNSLHPGKNQLVFAEHLLECGGYQMTLLETMEHFTMQLIFEKERGWLTAIKKTFQKFLKKIFGLRKKPAGCEKINIAALLADFQTSLFSLLAFSVLINSKEKWEIIQKYFPLFKEREIGPEKAIIALTKATEEKRENLNSEEFEKVLKELIEKR